MKLLVNLLIAVAGPIATVYLYAGVEAGKLESLIFNVLILSVVTVVVSAAAQRLLKRPLLAACVSIPSSEILYVLLLTAYIYCMPQGVERSESLMWLPIAILFLIPFAFPTAISVSYGTARIVRDLEYFGDSRRNRTPGLAKRLFEDETRKRVD